VDSRGGSAAKVTEQRRRGRGRLHLGRAGRRYPVSPQPRPLPDTNVAPARRATAGRHHPGPWVWDAPEVPR